ncbi:MAG: type I-E CRISPR-associated protein Cse1/CasA [Casimicrobiaceae bacterium]|nr:type I-E CRISPR-associated protein Cse1/CasA [Casimicrobiaceae bacterium]
MHDLLCDPLLGVETRHGRKPMSLPELFSALSAGAVMGYTGLRAHQADPWHVFLVQLAASIQAREPTETLPTDAAYWRNGLLHLADGVAEAWQLVVEDVTKPAFLQHPWTSWESDAESYGVKLSRGKPILDPKARTPDELDVLVTAKNHDVKMARVEQSTAEAWIYALLTLQTTSGYLGQGKYGIVRMNGGFASRVIVAYVRELNPSSRFIDEVRVLVQLREQTIELFRYQPRGVVLTWLTPWHRPTHQFMLQELEPWFIEAVRPIRLRFDAEGRIVALGATSQARQIGPASLENGDVGDPWTPLNVRDKKKGHSALTLSKDGFTPERLCALLFEDGFRLTRLQQPQPGEGVGWFVASCLVRGQGKTDGFHHVALPIPPKVRLALLNRPKRDSLAELSQALLKDAASVHKALGVALTLLTEGGPEQPQLDRVDTWVASVRREFAEQWALDFFPTLWRGADEPHEQVRREWQCHLVEFGQVLLDGAISRLPLPSNRRWRALTRAESAWRGLLHKAGLPQPARTQTELASSEESLV